MDKLQLKNMQMELFLFSDIGDREIILSPKQVHKVEVNFINLKVDNNMECDAFITKNPDLTLGIRTADCAAICFGDGEKIGIAHVGWRGLCAGMIEKMFTYFTKDKTEIYIAPFLHQFQIQKDFCYDQIAQKFGEEYFTNKDGSIIFNFKGAAASLLPPQTIFDKRDTETDLSLPSFRRDKTTERLVTAVSFFKK